MRQIHGDLQLHLRTFGQFLDPPAIFKTETGAQVRKAPLIPIRIEAGQQFGQSLYGVRPRVRAFIKDEAHPQPTVLLLIASVSPVADVLPSQALQKGGLPGCVTSENSGHSALVDLHVDRAQHEILE